MKKINLLLIFIMIFGIFLNSSDEYEVKYLNKLQSVSNGSYEYIEAIGKLGAYSVLLKDTDKIKREDILNKLKTIKVYNSAMFRDLKTFGYAYEKNANKIYLIEAYFKSENRLEIALVKKEFSIKNIIKLIEHAKNGQLNYAKMYNDLIKETSAYQPIILDNTSEIKHDNQEAKLIYDPEKRIYIKKYILNAYVNNNGQFSIIRVIKENNIKSPGLGVENNIFYELKIPKDDIKYKNRVLRAVYFKRKVFKNTWDGKKEGIVWLPIDMIKKSEE